MVKIRLSRGGGKKAPFYHLTVTDGRNRRDGSYIERVGYYNPVAKGSDVPLRIDMERVDYWLGKGAQASDRVASLIKRHLGEMPSAAAEAPTTEAPTVTEPAPEAVEDAPPAE